MIKKIGESVASFSVIILTLGIIKQVLYYLGFNLPIKYFMSLSEIGLLISDDLLLISSFLLILLLAMTSQESKVTQEEERQIFEDREEKIKQLSTEARRKIKRLDTMTLVIFIVMVVASVSLLFNKQYFTRLLGLAMLIAVVFLVFLEYCKKFIYTKTNRVTLTFLLTIILFILFIIIKTGFDIESVKNGKYFGTKIVMDDSIYISNAEKYFIGKTIDFIFIYNTKDSSTDVLPVSKIKQIVLKVQ